MNTAFQITNEDVCNVLRQNWTKVADTKGLSFEAYAEVLFEDLSPEDFGAIEAAALAGGDDIIEEQLPAAYEELRTILVRDGVLKS